MTPPGAPRGWYGRRRAGELFAGYPGARADLVDVSRSLGLGARPDADDIGRNAPLQRTMQRLVRFRMAAWRGDDLLGIHPKLPVLERSSGNPTRSRIGDSSMEAGTATLLG